MSEIERLLNALRTKISCLQLSGDRIELHEALRALERELRQPEVEPQATCPDQQIEFWLIWNPKRHAPTKKHYSEVSAEQEARRLAENNPGEHFFVLKTERDFIATINPVSSLPIRPGAEEEITEAKEKDIPF